MPALSFRRSLFTLLCFPTQKKNTSPALCIFLSMFYHDMFFTSCSVEVCGVLWGFIMRPRRHSPRTVVGLASERPSLILSPCSCFDADRSGESMRKKPPTTATTFCLSPVLYLTRLNPCHVAARAEQEGESMSSSLNSLPHSNGGKRKGGLLY